MLITYKALHVQAPTYIQELLQPYVPSRNLRSSSKNLLIKPHLKLNSYGKRAFSVAAPELWILNLQALLTVLKTSLKHFFLFELKTPNLLF